MRLAATIFSWLGGIALIVLEFVLLGRGMNVTKTFYYFNYTLGYSIPYTTTQHIAAPDWDWILMGIFAFGQIIILLWRQFALMNGKKMACGICTLIFCSIVGGILTLCIPEDELY